MAGVVQRQLRGDRCPAEQLLAGHHQQTSLVEDGVKAHAAAARDRGRGQTWTLPLGHGGPPRPQWSGTLRRMAEWIYFIHAPRDNFAATMTQHEREVWDEHFSARLLAVCRGRPVAASGTNAPAAGADRELS